jgi:mediator of replication checkpoint protein 1
MADSEEDVRPRGRLAARMQGGSPKPRTTSQDTNTDEDDLPVLSRRLKQRPARDSATPPPRSPIARSSSALFVSSAPPSPAQPVDEAENSNSEEEFPALKSDRFKALVERKRQERLAREAEEERKREERLARQAELDAQILEDDDNDSSITDDEGGRKLTQGARPTRKAGKKAIEEMNRETQRMARNMQLAHEAKTRKKITKASLFERFNFKTTGAAAAAPEANNANSSRPTSPISIHSDVEMGDGATPPSSPPTDKAPKADAVAEVDDLDEDVPDVDDVLRAAPQPKVDKGKGKAIDSPQKPAVTEAKPKRQFRVRLPQVPVSMVSLDPDDDELQVVMTRKERLDAIFNSVNDKKQVVAAPVSRKPKRKGDVPIMTASELSFSLMQRAREQAKAAREQRLEMLRSKGIYIQTEEEREKEMQSVDDIVTRARKEAEEIMERERAAAKQDRKDKIKNGELDPLAWDDSDDEEYEGSDEGQDAVEEGDVELSGSEDEEEAGDADSDAEDAPNALVDDQASEEDADEDDEEAELPTTNARRTKKKNIHVISDDEEDSDSDIVEATPRPKVLSAISPAAPNTKSPAVPTSVLRSARKTFIPGLPVAGAAGLGLTQIFAGTMDDSQAGPLGGTMQSPMPTLGSFPDFANMSQDDTQLDVDRIPDSQTNVQQEETQARETQGIQLHFTQSQMHGFDSLLREDEDMDSTQLSFEPSQDVGLAEYTPLKRRFVEPSPSLAPTATPAPADDPDIIMDSPLVRRGRLRKKIASIAEETEETTVIASTFDEKPVAVSAFNVMANAAKKEKKRKEFLKKKSKARGMFEEQAEESEDEYAGLGGADGEDSSDDDAASVKEMIDDDATGNADDERKIAALYA